jgi:hypothetical protein
MKQRAKTKKQTGNEEIRRRWGQIEEQREREKGFMGRFEEHHISSRESKSFSYQIIGFFYNLYLNIIF